VAFAYTLATLITTIIGGATLDLILESLLWFGASTLGRGLTLVALDSLAVRAGAHSKAQLREALMSAFSRRGADWVETRRRSDLITLMGQGLDALDSYFGKYLPQLIVATVVTPVVVLVLYTQDFLTGIAVTVTLPLIPVFMALVGWVTASVQKTQWDALQALAGSFLDTIEGLATLKIFGRHHRQRARIQGLSSDYRTRTMKVLKVSFLSSFVLELAASLSVAVVAVSIGLRLIDQEIPLSLGLFVLILVPEVFLPLRAVGAQFHSASEGLEAAQRVFEILDDEPPAVIAAEIIRASSSQRLTCEGFQAHRAGRPIHEPVSFSLGAGDIIALVGPSGSGKSSFADALLGFTSYSGNLLLDGAGSSVVRKVSDVVAWAPQFPFLGMGTIADNVALGDETPDLALVEEALNLAAASQLDPETSLGVGGQGLSGGQAQRVALARAYYRALRKNTPFLLLDEVSSALDADTEHAVIAGIQSLASRGYGVLLVSHRQSVQGLAHSTVRVTALEYVS